ncbi:MAG: hypothetical protein IJ563_09020 [Selenomonadaceae bacterium]|nr:hypothetical protein [Selenomonadaceae bacterium]MBR1859522.1 hypothetical protein [Selenomonadaceae bacterium]
MMNKHNIKYKLLGFVLAAGMFILNVSGTAHAELYEEEINQVRNEINQATENLSQQIKSDIFKQVEPNITQQITDMVPAQVSEQLAPLGSMTGYAAFIALVIAIAALLVGIYIGRGFSMKMNNLSRDLKEQNKLKDIIARQNDEIVKLQVAIKNLNIKPNAVESNVPDNDNNKEIESRPKPKSPKLISIKNDETPPEPPPDKSQEFLDAINELQQAKGFEARELKEKIINKFNIRAFFCKNADARMNQPELPIVLAEVSPAKGAYWAYAIGNDTYAVVPNLNTYTAHHHIAGGMSEAFDSNFAAGKVYNNIEVEKPALFTGNWQVIEKGKLNLS